MRERRKRVKLTPEQLARARARSYANTYLRRGHLARGPCCECGAPGEEMHHADYSKPLEIRWYCRLCHLAHHERERVRAATGRAAPRVGLGGP